MYGAADHRPRSGYALVRGGPLVTDKGTRRGPTKCPQDMLCDRVICVLDEMGHYLQIAISDLWGPMGNLWGTYGESMGTYGESMGTYGDPMGTYGDSMGTYGESVGIYGGSMGTDL